MCSLHFMATFSLDFFVNIVKFWPDGGANGKGQKTTKSSPPGTMNI